MTGLLSMNKTFVILLTTLALITLLLESKAHAKSKDNYFVLNTIALHFDNAKERNAVVPGFGWEHSPSKGLGWHTGTFSDSFGSRAAYIGINVSTSQQTLFNQKFRFLVGATILRKQYHKNKGLQTKVVPLPAIELTLTQSTVLNVSGSPEIDFNGEHNNAVMFFQIKMKI